MRAFKGTFFIRPKSVSLKYSLILMLSLAAVTSLAQSQRIDSLKSLLGETSGLERGQLFYQLAIEYVDVDNRVAMNYVNNAIPLVVSSGDSLWIVKSGRVKSQLYRRLDEIDSSETISHESCRLPNGTTMQMRRKNCLTE